MGKVRNIVIQDMKKILGSSTFWLAVVATALICFTGSMARDTYGLYNYNIVDILTDFSVNDIKENLVDANVKVIFLKETGSYLWMFAPVLAGMPLIPLLCAERKNKAMRYELVRVGKKRFALGKLLSSMISGGMVFMFGYALFGILLAIIFPVMGTDKNVIRCIDIMLYNHPDFIKVYDAIGYISMIGLKLAGFFVYGALSAVFAYIMSSFVTNKYIVLCVPYILNYMLSSFIDKQSMSMSFWELPKWFTSNFVNLKVNTSTQMFQVSWSEIGSYFALHIMLVICSLIIYNIIMSRRCDCGQ